MTVDRHVTGSVPTGVAEGLGPAGHHWVIMAACQAASVRIRSDDRVFTGKFKLFPSDDSDQAPGVRVPQPATSDPSESESSESSNE